jgi:pimeloyl-ACP methyl ester carboxylesterase
MTDGSERLSMVGSEGRALAVEWWGDPDGYPVFLLHGMPGSRLGPRPRGIVLERMGIRLISYDRPGYGLSDRQAGRTVASAGIDVERIAESLKLEEFAVAGRSGGGPHALACAARMQERIQRVALLVSVAPPDAPGLKWDDGMSVLNVRDFADVDRSMADAPVGAMPEAAELAQRAAVMQEDPESLIRFLQPELTASDRRFVDDRAMRDLLTATYAEAVRKGGAGWIDDAIALRSPWDFKFDEISCPVLLWHGGDDRFSPASHTHWMAEQLRAVRRDEEDKLQVKVQIDRGAAHFAAFEIFTDVLNWLVDPYLAPAPSLARTAAGRALGGSGRLSAAQPHSDVRGQSEVQAVR